MSASAKHAYRFGFLRSEEWKGIRLELISEDRARCCFCGSQNWSNDIHHVSYPKRWGQTSRKHAVVLCRECHEFVHSLFGNKMPTKNRWLFEKAGNFLFHKHGRNFTAKQFKACVRFSKTEKFHDQQRFLRACVSAGYVIRKYLLTSTRENATDQSVT